MIKIECNGCRCDLNTGDIIFCEDCMKKTEKTIELLGEDIYILKKAIKEEQNIDALKKAIGEEQDVDTLIKKASGE